MTSLEGIFCPHNASLPLVWNETAISSGGGALVNMSQCASELQVAVVTWTSPFLVIGLACSAYSFIFCCGQILFTISVEGFYPRCLQGRQARSQTTPENGHRASTYGVGVDADTVVTEEEAAAQFRRRTQDIDAADAMSHISEVGGGSPVVALHIGGVLIFVTLLLLFAAMGPKAGDSMSAPLVSLSLLGACTSYILQLVAFISARRHRRRYALLVAAAVEDAAGNGAVKTGLLRGEVVSEQEEFELKPPISDNEMIPPPPAPFQSPFGIWGAVVGIVVATSVMVAIIVQGVEGLVSTTATPSNSTARGTNENAAGLGTFVLNLVYFCLLAFTMFLHALLVRLSTVAAPDGLIPEDSNGHSGRDVTEQRNERRKYPQIRAVLTCGGQCVCGLPVH